MKAPTYPYLEFLTRTPEETFRALDSGPGGLTTEAARAHLRKYGSNQIPRRKLHLIKVFFRQFANPFIYLLGVAAAIALILGETADALTILVILLVNGVLGFVQEYRAEHALSKLEELLVPQIRVVRNGQTIMLSIQDLVPGDLVPLAAGDVIPADLRIVETQGLLVDESILTGETVPAAKQAPAMTTASPELSEARTMGFSGTKIVGGRGAGVAVATGEQTVLGKIAHRLHQIERKSGYEEHLHRFSTLMMRIVVVTIVILFAAHLFFRGTQSNIAEFFLFVLALAVSVVPEALPVITTLTLSRGAILLAKKHVVVRRLSALEDIGNIDLLCTDKTGTITENKMQVAEVAAVKNEAALLKTALAETKWLLKTAPHGLASISSFDQALWQYAQHARANTRPESAAEKVVWDLPFDPVLRLSAIVIEQADNARTLLVRGAPEELLKRSTFTAPEQKKILSTVAARGKEGKRILAFAQRALDAREKLNVSAIRELAWQGYAAFVDPLKSTTQPALHEARELGVDVRIITGDSPEVAFAVGREIGLVNSEQEVQTGADLRAFAADKLDEIIERTKIFARVSPEEKFLIIQALQKRHAVGFLGEGINDAPALELANAAMVVQSASAVSREAADLVLLKRDLRVIVQAIAQGRAIFANVAKYLKYTLIGNFGNFYAIAGISLILPFVPLLPVQILLTNILTDLPLVAVAVDRVSKDEIKRPQLFALRPLIMFSIFLGLTSSLFDFLFFGLFRHAPEVELRTLWFILSILTELALIFSIRTRRFFLRPPGPAPMLLLAALLAGSLAAALPFWPKSAQLFHFIRPSAQALKSIGLLVLAYWAMTELVKLSLYRFADNPQKIR